MDKEFARKALTVGAILLVLPFSLAWALNRSEYEADKARIDEAYATDRATCNGPERNARRACIAQAKARQKLALAELEHAFTGRESDRIQVLRAQSEADELLARQPCDGKADGAQGRCLITAGADFGNKP